MAVKNIQMGGVNDCIRHIVLDPRVVLCTEGHKHAGKEHQAMEGKAGPVSLGISIYCYIICYYTPGTQKSIKFAPCSGDADSQPLSFGDGPTWI